MTKNIENQDQFYTRTLIFRKWSFHRNDSSLKFCHVFVHWTLYHDYFNNSCLQS